MVAYGKRRQYRSKPRPLGRIAILLVLLVLGYHLLNNWGTPQPAEALARALKYLELGELDSAQSYLERADDEEQLRDWVGLVRAQVLEKAGDYDKALVLYRKIPDSSPASADARVASIRLMLKKEKGEALLSGESIIELEKTLQKAFRRDLLPEVLYLKGEAARLSGNISLAQTLYQRIRKNNPKSPTVALAKKALTELSDQVGHQSGEESIAQLLFEAELLILEKDLLGALESVQFARTKTEKSTPAYFESLLLEEQILRTMKRNNEADHVLATISADGTLGTADLALLKMIKNAWNANEQKRALEFIENFEKRFPSSSLEQELLYVKARILEEVIRPVEAKAVYQKLAEAAQDPLNRMRAFRRIAWLHFRNKDMLHAAEFFQRIRTNVQRILAAQNKDPDQGEDLNSGAPAQNLPKNVLADLIEEQYHATFWLAYSLSFIGSIDRQQLPTSTKNEAELLNELVSETPYTFYGMLAARRLADKQAQNKASLTPVKNNSSDQCVIAVPEELIERLKLLLSASLYDFAQREIDWFFINGQKNTQGESPTPLYRLITALSRAELYSRFSHLPRGIGLAESILMTPVPLSPFGDSLETCRDKLVELSFPFPFHELFVEAANSYKLNLALLMALARTESHFDPQAVSSKEASGLLQLLPKTAASEGLTSEQNLFDPEVNIFLGAKHFSRLLARYQGEQIKAIAAYNAGSSAVKRWLERNPDLDSLAWLELISYPETKEYVKKVLLAEHIYTTQQRN